ncbi:hypothetical protein SB773_22540 [Bacillus sp. SIMBA_074]|uniref:hypothetical protein n=1 Tax=Bacillus sp. SIMBA_074 TaxID=3085812 RepID=UPI00397C6DE0
MSAVFNKPALFTKVITPPQEEFEGSKIKPSNYLIQNADGDNFLLFREIKKDEIEVFEGERIIEYDGKSYMMIANLPDEEHAMAAIQSYWRAIKELNSMTN